MSKYTIIIEDDDKNNSKVYVEFIQEFEVIPHQYYSSLSLPPRTLAEKMKDVIFPQIEKICKKMVSGETKDEN